MQKCFNCLEEKNVIRYYISNRGYGSYFDGIKSHIDLCDKCSVNVKGEWFYEYPAKEDYYEVYQYEDLLLNFIENLPPEGQWNFWVKYNCGIINTGYAKIPGWLEWSDDFDGGNFNKSC